MSNKNLYEDVIDSIIMGMYESAGVFFDKGQLVLCIKEEQDKCIQDKGERKDKDSFIYMRNLALLNACNSGAIREIILSISMAKYMMKVGLKSEEVEDSVVGVANKFLPNIYLAKEFIGNDTAKTRYIEELSFLVDNMPTVKSAIYNTLYSILNHEDRDCMDNKTLFIIERFVSTCNYLREELK